MQACGGGGGGVGWQLASQAVWFATLPGVPPGTTRHVGLGMVRSHRYSSGRVSVQLGPAHPGSQMHPMCPLNKEKVPRPEQEKTDCRGWVREIGGEDDGESVVVRARD